MYTLTTCSGTKTMAGSESSERMTAAEVAAFILLIIWGYREACFHLAEKRWEARFDNLTDRVQAATLTDLIRNRPAGQRGEREAKEIEVPAVRGEAPGLPMIEDDLDAASTVRAMTAARRLTE